METKSVFTSVTFWSLLLTIGSQIAARAGIVFPGDIAGTANDIVSLVSAGATMYGRWRATQPLSVAGGSK